MLFKKDKEPWANVHNGCEPCAPSHTRRGFLERLAGPAQNDARWIVRVQTLIVAAQTEGGTGGEKLF
jgi:hypothetical protein